MRILCGTILAAAMAVQGAECVADSEDYSRWVNPFVGTSATGHTFPAACVPFGLVQAGPDTVGADGLWWHYCSGYRYEDSRIVGFSQTHLNGTGGIDLGDISILPLENCENVKLCKYGNMEVPNGTAFDKSSEVAEPGYYAVTLDCGIKVEIAAAEHSAIYRFTYEKGGSAHLLVDTLYGLSLRQQDTAKSVVADVHIDGKSGMSGTIRRPGWVSREIAFTVRFDRPAVAHRAIPSRREGETAPRYVFDFDMKDGEMLSVKIALSAGGGFIETALPKMAKRNLDAEIPGWNFDAVKGAARAKWNEVLSKATIEGTDDQKKNWYTSLYHLFIQPNNIADDSEKPFYSTLSTWDTFRAAHPLYTILAPDKAEEFVDSMLEQGRRTGYLPIWTLWGKDNQCMIGTHSVPVIVDWFLKECKVESVKCKVEGKKYYWLAAYAQIKDTLTKPHKGRIKERWDLLDKYGYYPFDEIKGESVSRTLECVYDDWCAGVMAQRLWELFTNRNCHNCSQITNANVESLKADAEFFFKRSDNWRNVFDPSIGLVRGKDTKGNWREPYNPYALGHGADLANDFTEGNAFQYTWHVMQNPKGLVDALGGRDTFVKKLDSLFAAPTKTEGMGDLVDVTGLIGQYVHGNEPSHHVIYFYPQVGHPEKAADRIREVFDKFYLPKPDGLCGNDDCGQMSAWYLFSAMGFYPFNPCGGEYIIGAPQVEKVTLLVGNVKMCNWENMELCKYENGEVNDTNLNCHNCSQITNANSDSQLTTLNSQLSTCSTRLKHPANPVNPVNPVEKQHAFTIIARNLSKENKYVKSVTLNGKPITDWKIRHSDIMRGGELVFEMTTK